MQTQDIRPGEPVTLNFVGAEIEAVARTLATITGRNVVVDPRVKGQMHLVTDRPVPPAQAFTQFLAALRLQGFTVVEAAGLYKVVPEADAKLQSGSVGLSVGGAMAPSSSGQIATQIFKLNFENAQNLVPVLRPLISPNNTINVNPGNNALVITDYTDNLQRLARIIAAMDVSNATDVEIIPLQHAIATDLLPLLQRLVDGGGGGVSPSGNGNGNGNGGSALGDGGYKTTLLAEPRSNAIIVRTANAPRLAQVRALVGKLDQPAAAGSGAARGNIHVVYLKNADAAKLAITLRAAMASMVNPAGAGASVGTTAAVNTSSTSAATGSGLGMGAGLGSGTGSLAPSTQPSTGGLIQADPATNALIITAPDPLYRQLRAVIEQLDGRRAQVLVESLIVEVSTSKLAQFGIQWQSVIGSKGDGLLGALGNNSNIAGANILGVTAGLAQGTTEGAKAVTGLGKGMNVALVPRVAGQYYLGALANFLQNSGEANVLSTPNLLTLDNEEAKIVIGRNVPFPTGSYTNTGSNNGSVNPFTTVERKDVGLMLKVRPQINENGTVKLAIYQEASEIEEATRNNQNGPNTTKRSIESNVLVEDGGIIAIGGLLEDRYAQSEDKVPVMGDLPVVGNLFRSEGRRREKTNLMVFLRPTVVRDAASSHSLSIDRYDSIRALQQQAQPESSLLLGTVSSAPTLGPAPMPTQGLGQSETAPPPPPLSPSAAPDAPATPEPWNPAAAPQPLPQSAPALAQAGVPLTTPAPAIGPASTPLQASAQQTAASASATPTTPAASAIYYVIVGDYTSAAKAKNTLTALRKAKLAAATQTEGKGRTQRTRVRMGPFESAQKARSAAASVRALALKATLSSAAL